MPTASGFVVTVAARTLLIHAMLKAEDSRSEASAETQRQNWQPCQRDERLTAHAWVLVPLLVRSIQVSLLNPG